MEENLRAAGIVPGEKSAGWEAEEQRALLIETSRRDALADDTAFVRDIFAKMEKQHADLFNPAIARMVLEFLDAVQSRKKEASGTA